MATLDDLSQGVVSALGGLLFPGVTYVPGGVANVTAAWTGAAGGVPLTIPVRLYRGAPEIAALSGDIAAGIANVCVTSVPGMSRNTTRFMPFYTQTTVNTPTLLVAWTAAGVTFSGLCGVGQIVGVTVAGIAYAYRVQATDTPALVAAIFAASISGATAVGTLLSAANTQAANVVCDQVAALHTGQEQQMVQVAILAPNVPAAGGGFNSGYLVRAALARIVDGLKSIFDANGNLTRFIGLPDGTTAKVVFTKQTDDDTPRNNDIWRRWIYFLCDYDETVPIIQTPALSASTLLAAPSGALVWLSPQPNITSVLTDGAGNALEDQSGDILGTY